MPSPVDQNTNLDGTHGTNLLNLFHKFGDSQPNVKIPVAPSNSSSSSSSLNLPERVLPGSPTHSTTTTIAIDSTGNISSSLNTNELTSALDNSENHLPLQLFLRQTFPSDTPYETLIDASQIAELTDSLDRLSLPNSSYTRIESAHKFIYHVNPYRIQNILGVWQSVKDLLYDKATFAEAKAAYSILKCLCAATPLSLRESECLLHAINWASRPIFLADRIKSINLIVDQVDGSNFPHTANNDSHPGNNVPISRSLISHVSLIRVLQGLLSEAFQYSLKRFICARQHGEDLALSTDESVMLDQIFQLLARIYQVAETNGSRAETEEVVRTIFRICKQTCHSSDIHNSIHLISILVNNTDLSGTSLHIILELLSDVFRQLPTLRDEAWCVLEKIFHSNFSNSAINILLELLRGSRKSCSSEYSATRAAFLVLSELYKLTACENTNNDHVTHPILEVRREFVQSVGISVERFSGKHKIDVYQFFAQVFSNQTLYNYMTGENELEFVVDYILVRNRDPANAKQEVGEVDDIRSDETIHSKSTHGSSASSIKYLRSIQDKRSVRSFRKNRLGKPGPSSKRVFKRSDVVREKSIKAIQELLTAVNDRFLQEPLRNQLHLAKLFLKYCELLNDSSAWTLVNFLKQESDHIKSELHILYISIINGIIHSFGRTETLRIKGVEIIANLLRKNINNIHRNTNDRNEFLNSHVNDLLWKRLLKFTSPFCEQVIREILTLASEYTGYIRTEKWLCYLLGFLEKRLFKTEGLETEGDPEDECDCKAADDATEEGMIGAGSSVGRCTGEPILDQIIVEYLVRWFGSSLMGKMGEGREWKIRHMFNLLVKIARSERIEVTARIMVLEILLRIRVSKGGIFSISRTSDSYCMGRILSRGDGEDIKTSTGSSGRTSPGELPKWIVRPVFVPICDNETCNTAANRDEAGENSKNEIQRIRDSDVLTNMSIETVGSHDQVNISEFLEVILYILLNSTNWEIYTFVIANLSKQLCNYSLFAHSSFRQVQMLRSILIEKLRASSFPKPPESSRMKRSDVALCFVQCLTSLIGYGELFAKSEQDDLVHTFLISIGPWGPDVNRLCIHALTICCYELPVSLVKCLENILQRMTQIITQQNTAIDILEFLSGLVRLPDLVKNCRDEHFKMVFGICFRYLQHVWDRAEAQETAVDKSKSGNKLSSVTHNVESNLSDTLPQYVLALLFHVMNSWFMTLKLENRSNYLPWITKNLAFRQTDQRIACSLSQQIEDRCLTTIDFMMRITYTDRDETEWREDFADSLLDGIVSEKAWIVGHSLFTVQTAVRSGISQIIRRRPTATRHWIVRPNLTKPPIHHQYYQELQHHDLPADVLNASDSTRILPEEVFQEFYSSLLLTSPFEPMISGVTTSMVHQQQQVPISPGLTCSQLSTQSLTPKAAPFTLPVPLPQNDVVKRAINALDRVSVIDCHKIGIIYIDRDQDQECQFFANTHGSPEYHEFIQRIGTLIPLKGIEMNTQGLDRQNGTDGELLLAWRDGISEIVFHVTTLMPSDKVCDPTYTNKKRHIGNDFVNIIWNESGKQFSHDWHKSAFNYLFIVITPERASDIHDDPSQLCSVYTVEIHAIPDFINYISCITTSTTNRAHPPVSIPCCPTRRKLIHRNNIAALVRHLALNSSVVCHVYSAQKHLGPLADYSSWAARLKELRSLQARFPASFISTHKSSLP